MKDLLLVVVGCFLFSFANADDSTTPDDSTTTPAWTPDPNCPYPSDIMTYDYYPGNCSMFYECDHGNRYTMSCPSNLLWNHIANYCDYPENVDCTRTRTTPEPGPTEPTHPPSSDCVGKADGTLLPDPYDCRKYYECLRDVAIEMSCPAGTVWNTALSTCDYPTPDCPAYFKEY